MVLPLLCRGRKRQSCSERMRWNRKQKWNWKTAPSGNGWLWEKKFVAKAENLTVGQLLDVWAEEELKTGTLSNGTVENYLGTIRNIKKHPLAERKLKNVTSEHLQSFLICFPSGEFIPTEKRERVTAKITSILFRSHAAVLPLCSISKTVYYV